VGASKNRRLSLAHDHVDDAAHVFGSDAIAERLDVTEEEIASTVRQSSDTLRTSEVARMTAVIMVDVSGLVAPSDAGVNRLLADPASRVSEPREHRGVGDAVSPPLSRGLVPSLAT